MVLYFLRFLRWVVIAHQMTDSFEKKVFIRDSRFPVSGQSSSCVIERLMARLVTRKTQRVKDKSSHITN